MTFYPAGLSGSFRRGGVGLLHRAPELGVPGVGRDLRLSDGRLRRLAGDDLVALLVREAHVQRVARLLLDVPGLRQLDALPLQRTALGGQALLLSEQLVDLLPLRDVLANRV